RVPRFAALPGPRASDALRRVLPLLLQPGEWNERGGDADDVPLLLPREPRGPRLRRARRALLGRPLEADGALPLLARRRPAARMRGEGRRAAGQGRPLER